MRLLLSALAAVLLAAAPAASAHDLWRDGNLYNDGSRCVHVVAGMQHGSGGGQTNVGVDGSGPGFSIGLWGIGFSVGCVTAWDRPPGYIALRWTLFVWGPYSTSWGVCADRDYLYNQESRSWMQRGNDFGVHAPCGDAYYLDRALGWFYNGGWLGGGLDSPYHYFTWF